MKGAEKDQRLFVRFQDAALERLGSAERRRAPETLHLGPRAVHALAAEGIETIEALVERARAGFSPFHTEGTASVAEINAALRALARSVRRGGTVDWVEYASQRGFLILPEEDLSNVSTRQYLSVLAAVFNRAVKSRFGPAALFAFEQSLMRKTPLPLVTIGQRLGRTKQAASVLKQNSVRMLRGAVWAGTYSGCRFRFRPEVVSPLWQLRRRLAEAQGSLLIYCQWEEALHAAWGATTAELDGLEKLLLSLLDYQVSHASGIRHAPIVQPANISTSRVTSALRRAEQLLRFEFPAGLSEKELFEKLSSLGETAAPRGELRKLIMTIPGIEEVSPRGRLRFRIERLHRMSDQLERLLRDRGRPTHFKELARELGRFEGRQGSTRGPRQVSVALSDDTRFVSIRRSGLWSLTEWNIETRTIAELAYELLRSAKRPMTEAQMYPPIAKRRPLKPDSIGRLLHDDPRFRRVAPCTWALQDLDEQKGASLRQAECSG